MTQEEINKLYMVSKNVTNVKTLLEDLVMPISAMMEKYNCTQKNAVSMKLKAETYLSKYGCLTLDSSTKILNEIIQNINKPKIIQQKIFTPTNTQIP